MSPTLITHIAALAGGGALGSFLSLASQRFTPALSPAQWFALLCFPGSHCNHCQQRLLWRDALPLVSWPGLKGRCRFCHRAFGAESFVIEWLFAILCLLVLQSFDHSAEAIFIITASGLLLIVAAIDRRHFCIPDPLNYLLLWSGLFHATVRNRNNGDMGCCGGLLCVVAARLELSADAGVRGIRLWRYQALRSVRCLLWLAGITLDCVGCHRYGADVDRDAATAGFYSGGQPAAVWPIPGHCGLGSDSTADPIHSCLI